ncbi:Protein sidekick [Lamellibrachia satsuma]|nr:Protein sidekick [Lamellibrachia satsuma]
MFAACRTYSLSETSIPSTAIHLTENGIRGNLGDDEGGFSTFQMRQSQRRSHRGPPRSNALPPYIRSPPRPSPGSVIYSDEELKASAAGGDDDSSSLTEKPSDSGSDTTDSQESDSDLDSEKDIPPPAFSNHYVNGNVQQSWQRNRTPYNAAYSYPDSEADSSQYGMMLNGGHILMNNMAGSRTPLPGFSSFV